MFSLPQGSKARFMDTMSLHMAISGLTGFQRTLWMANKMGKRRGLQEVKEHIKKTGQKKDGPAVCVLLFTVFHLQRAVLLIMLHLLVGLVIWRLLPAKPAVTLWFFCVCVCVYRLAPGTG